MLRRPPVRIGIDDRRLCRNLNAKLCPHRPYKELKHEINDPKNQFILLKKDMKLVSFMIYKAKQNSENNYAQVTKLCVSE
jgi:hypothetical protein